MARSRLSRNFERRAKRNFYLTLLGIIFIIGLLIKFGIPALANFTLFITSLNSSDDSQINRSQDSFISPPILNAVPSATNSAYLTLSGTALSKQKVNLYINNRKIDSFDVKKDGNFSFENIKLSIGENTIKLKAVENNKSSDFSDEVTVIFRDKPPSLSVDSPENGKSFSKDDSPIKVSGKTEAGSKVTVNDHWAIVNDQGEFSYNLPLNQGENTIKIAATDEAGNKTEQEQKVTYNP